MEIQHTLISDHAEIVNGKLYLMGGGWDTYYAREVPTQIRVAVAVGISIEWDETNETIPVHVYVEDDDAQQLARIQGTMQVGRPPNLRPGSRQLSQLAANLNLNVKQHGGFRVRTVAGEGERQKESSIAFRVVERPPR